MIEINVINNEKPILGYPVIMVTAVSEYIIMVNENDGFILPSVFCKNGFYGKNWDTKEFKKLNGSILLTNA